MKFSVITLTAGRVEHLNECVESFLRQDHGDRELIVLNTLPQQTLLGQFPKVRIINFKVRPPNLGAARNMAIEACDDDSIVCVLDDDDLALPHLLSEYARHFDSTPDAQWIWVDRQFYFEKGKIAKISSGMCNTFSFRKSAWKAVGGYNALTVGEDRDFVGRVTQRFPGLKAAVDSDRIAYCYCWGNGVYHVSGQGDDTPKNVPAWERSRLHLESLLRRGFIPQGEIQLKPNWKADYQAMVDDFIGKLPVRGKDAPNVCMVMLGRYGDIINILPVARMIAERYGKPAMMVSREFADVLDGVGYVIPHPVDLIHSELLPAISIAEKEYPYVLRCQIWGKGHNQTKLTEAYNIESWREAGFLPEFYNDELLPVFDRRDAINELALYKKLSDGRPMLLLKLHGGQSSPFNGVVLEALIRATFDKDYQVVELTSIKTERIHDLLGLFDRASALVSIDTMTLHLAAASGIPVVALTNSMPWLGTACRANAIATISYKAATLNPKLVITATNEALKKPNTAIETPTVSTPIKRGLFHAVERHEEPRNKRKEEAWKSWDALYAKGVIPCHYRKYKRNALDIGDRRPLPYLKDVLEFSMESANLEDIIFFTNDDNVLHPDLAEYLRFHVSVYGACSAQRREVREPIPRLPHPIPMLAKLGVNHGGRDLFAFTKSWLTSMWDKIPDFVLGASDWDWCLASIIRLDHGVKTTRKNIETSIYPAEIPQGYVLHQFHPPTWMRPENELKAASQKHNRLLFKTWASANLPELRFTPENRL